MRTFVAVPLEAGARSMLELLQRQLRAAGADVRWTAVESIHLTLKFLGEVDPGLVPRLAEMLRRACARQACFALDLGGLGAFPGTQSPRVVWCGIQGDLEQLRALQRRVEETCLALGFPPEQREFRPHLTLGRVRGPRNLQRLSECIRIGSELRSRLPVDKFHVYRSTLTPHGAVYQVLETVELQA